jgi:hypothetical protein
MTMSRLAFALAAAAAVAGCSSSERRAEAIFAEDPVAVECRAEAQQSPGVRAAMRQINPNNTRQTEFVYDQRREAEGQAFNDCMRRRGAARRGGVEFVRRPGFFNFSN